MVGRVLLITLLAVFALAACGPVPRPFKASPGAKESNPLLVVPDGAGITVVPVAGASPALSGPLTEALVYSLRRAGIPASAGAALTNGLLMEGVARWRDGEAVVDWRLTDPDGALAAEVRANAPAARTDFEAGSVDLINALADRSAAMVATALRPDELAGTIDGPPPTVAVVGVDGAPGDGDRALSRAMRAVLAEAGVPLADGEAEAALLLAGAVSVEAIGETRERVTIRWWLLDDSGLVLGTLEQANEVPKGALSDRWGGAAYDAALANVEAVQDILDRIDQIREIQRGATVR